MLCSQLVLPLPSNQKYIDSGLKDNLGLLQDLIVDLVIICVYYYYYTVPDNRATKKFVLANLKC